MATAVYTDSQVYFPLLYTARIKGTTFTCYSGLNGEYFNKENINTAEAIIMSSDYILYGEANPSYSGIVIERSKTEDELESIFKVNIDDFLLLKRFKLPNETFLTIYKNKHLLKKQVKKD